ncbi:MAG: hypothetical protein Q8P68_04080 [Candidatus Peregrinibacteria bacterium]|nr:hypothetical protein [Candidatus Peregrinibacteria bacterium]MDZ4245287.1 hypothetical protein [Candidatus Gracilibacteria bacterium]
MKKITSLIVAISIILLVGCGGGASNNTINLGGTFELNGSTITANYLLDGWVHPTNEYDAAFDGNKAVVVNITVEAGDEEFSELSSNFSLGYGSEVVESTNYVGITDDSGLHNCGATVKALATETTTCDLVFEVLEGSDVSAPTFVYEPLFGDIEAQTFELK